MAAFRRALWPFAFALLLLLPGSCLAQSDFTIVVLPDTQYYSSKYPTIFNAQTQWIANNAASQNIQLVIGVGDVVDGNTTTQWTRANTAVQYMESVPYLLAIGNHDYDKGDSAPLRRLATQFNKYFGPSRYTTKTYYKGNWGGSNENFYGIVNLGGTDYLVLVLEFNPRRGAVEWAKSILEQNASLPTIVVTHSYGYHNGRVSFCDSYAAERYGLNDDNDGQELWQSFVSQYANISLVLSGHIIAYSGIGHRVDLGVNGNVVNQVLADYQNYTNGGNGYLRIMKFHPSQGTISVTTYSPYLKTYLTDSNNQFTLYTSPHPGSTTTVTGHVFDRTACTNATGVTVTAGTSSTTTDSYGNYTVAVTPGAQVDVTVSKAGYFSQTNTVTPAAGYATNIDWAIEQQ